MTPGLPWPWRACKGGRVLAENGECVTRCPDRRQARALIREVELLLRDLVGTSAPVASSLLPEVWTICANGVEHTYTATAQGFADAFNASASAAFATASAATSGTVTLTFRDDATTIGGFAALERLGLDTASRS